MVVLNAPIPGQSLTTPPRNAPYERPPEITDPDEALAVHLKRLSDPDAIEDAMYVLEIGIDVQTLVEGITRSAVMAGIHSIDVSLIIQPVLHEFIKQTADALDVDYSTGFEEEDRDELRKTRASALADKKLDEMGIDVQKNVKDVDLSSNEGREQEMEEVVEEITTVEKPKGLMAKD
jgi:hypothetical protein